MSPKHHSEGKKKSAKKSRRRQEAHSSKPALMSQVMFRLALLVVASLMSGLAMANSLVIPLDGLEWIDKSNSVETYGDSAHWMTMGASTDDMVVLTTSDFFLSDATPNRCFGFKYPNKIYTQKVEVKPKDWSSRPVSGMDLTVPKTFIIVFYYGSAQYMKIKLSDQSYTKQEILNCGGTTCGGYGVFDLT